MLKRLFALAAAILLLAGVMCVGAAAKQPIDEIQRYEISISPRDDGTLDMKFLVEWKVLDEDEDGDGLTWVKIGIPNMHADEITALTDNITDASYYTDSGAYVRVDLDREYMAGETVLFSFSIHQSYMYRLKDGTVEYTYTPGWFEDIAVKSITVYWNSRSVLDSDAPEQESGRLVWSGSLEPDERFPVKVTYDRNVFPGLDPEATYTERYISTAKVILIIALVALFVGIVVAAAVVAERSSDPYMAYRGFTGAQTHVYVGGMSPMLYPGVGRRGVVFGGGSGGSGGGHSGGGCACACACACAGGGRAGCSRKDFYGTKLRAASVREALLRK
jgi:hypothetical protein